jgi:hypothetical protein
MHVSRRREFRLAIPLLALVSLPAHSQNLLVNSGFDRDLAGWTSQNFSYPDPAPMDAYATPTWSATDAAGNTASGGLSLHVGVGYHEIARVSLGQCFDASEGQLVSFGAKILTNRQFGESGVSVDVAFFDSPTCGGSQVGSAQATSVGLSGYPVMSSQGLFLPASAAVLSPSGSRSMRVGVTGGSVGNGYYWFGYVDAIADDVYAFLQQADPAATRLLPSSARGAGAYGSLWTTTLTLANAGAADALVTLKFLGHDADGRAGDEKSVLVRAGSIFEYPDVLGSLFGRSQDYGAIRITSSSASVAVQSETSTPESSGGTVGQALPAFGPADYASTTPKTLAPIRENGSFRTNLILANPAEIPVTAHVALFAADGTPIGSRDVDLPPLGMTQLSRVAALLGAPTLDLGRISVSTPTPGGLVAAYASVIDNVTNDPRTLLPQDVVAATTGQDLLLNPGFERDLSGWSIEKTASGNGGAGAGWQSSDVSGSSNSGPPGLGASASGYPGSRSASASQCVAAVIPGRTYGLRAWVLTSGWAFLGGIPSPSLHAAFFKSVDCTGTPSLSSISDPRLRPFNASQGSDGDWFEFFAPGAVAPADAGSVLVSFGVGAAAGVHGLAISADFDDVVLAEGASAWTSFLPAAASVYGSGGSHWTTDVSLSNTGARDASVYLEFLDGCSGCSRWVTNVPAGRSVSLKDILVTVFQRSSSWGALRFTATSPSITITSETSTPTAGGGTVGQALAAVARADLIGAAPKSIAPVRDDGAFRTNLVVLNATELPLTAHVELFDASGLLVGSRDLLLGPLAMAQINGVGWSLAEASVHPGRISVSTPTPGGLVAAYASVIDNVTNDPRTLLPR